MSQQTFDGTTTHGVARAIWNGNAIDVEQRVSALETALGNSVITNGLAAFDLAASDQNRTVLTSNVGGVTLTVQPEANVSVPVGARFTYIDTGDAGLTVVEGAGVSFQSAFSAPLTVTGGVLELVKIDTNVWSVSGDLVGGTPAAPPPWWYGFLDIAQGNVSAGNAFDLLQDQIAGNVVFSGGNTVTVNEAGQYTLSLHFYGTRNTSTLTSLTIQVNGSNDIVQLMAIRRDNDIATTMGGSCSVSYRLQAGDQIQVKAGSSGTTPTVSNLRNVLSIAKTGT